MGEALNSSCSNNVRLVQGSHIVVPKIHDHDRAYIFQNADNRIIFALPYEQDYTLIGTTDQDYQGDPAEVKITEPEISYICSSASEYFEKPVNVDDVVWSYSGVRPLYNDGATEAQEATRDYVLRVDGDELPVINIFGGKITTYRKLSESMIKKIEHLIGARFGSWTATSHLPGGDFEVADYDSLVSKLKGEFEFLDSLLAKRLIRSYGTNAWIMLKGAFEIKDMGQDFGGTLSEREVEYLMKHEWAECAEDVVWRRSKIGIQLDKKQISVIEDWMQQKIVSDQCAEKLRSWNC